MLNMSNWTTFPFNWFPQRVGTRRQLLRAGTQGFIVSIQLVSPASGDIELVSSIEEDADEFPFNWFPQRVGTTGGNKCSVVTEMFPFNWFPQRVGT